MNVIFFSKREGTPASSTCASADARRAWPWRCSPSWAAPSGSACSWGMAAAAASPGQTAHWSQILAEQKRGDRRAQAADAGARRCHGHALGEVNAHVIRLDALGKRLTEMADIDSREFDFGSDPPQRRSGGRRRGRRAQIPDLSTMLKSLQSQIDLRDSQLSALENVILARELGAADPPGRPSGQQRLHLLRTSVEREDPFTGNEAYHKGVDFAGSDGYADVVAVAAGVVTWAGSRGGYGNLVEINHGDGYVTRYGHNEQVLVHVGETVKRGESVALMGVDRALHRAARALRGAAERPPGESAALRRIAGRIDGLQRHWRRPCGAGDARGRQHERTGLNRSRPLDADRPEPAPRRRRRTDLPDGGLTPLDFRAPEPIGDSASHA